LEQGFHRGVPKSSWEEARKRGLFEEERKMKQGSVLEREGHGSVLKTEATDLTGMKNWYDQSSLTDRKVVPKKTSFTLG
jgi:phage protein D